MLLQNRILTEGLRCKGVTLNKVLFHEFLELDSHELKLCPKITTDHVDLRGAKRMRVRPAAQLLSETTAKAISFLLPDKKPESEQILVIDSFFDVFNSRLPIADKQLRNPYGRYLIEQNKALENMEQYAKNAVVVGKEKRSFTFLKGLLVSTNSLKSLFTFVSTRYGVKYILTHRLNQDLLENLFSQVRAFGVTHDHPNTMEFRFRLRAVLLSKTRAEIPRTANSTTDDRSAFVSAQVFVSGTACSDRNTVLPIVTARPTAVPKQIASALECDVVRYISGYVAKKLRKNYEELGDPTAKAEEIGESWVDHLSRGGLIQPSPVLTGIKHVLLSSRIFANIVEALSAGSTL